MEKKRRVDCVERVDFVKPSTISNKGNKNMFLKKQIALGLKRF